MDINIETLKTQAREYLEQRRNITDLEERKRLFNEYSKLYLRVKYHTDKEYKEEKKKKNKEYHEEYKENEHYLKKEMIILNIIIISKNTQQQQQQQQQQQTLFKFTYIFMSIHKYLLKRNLRFIINIKILIIRLLIKIMKK